MGHDRGVDEPCFKFHYNEARRLGVGSGAMVAAVQVAQAVKETPARSMLDLAAKLLGDDTESLPLTDPGRAAHTAGAVDPGKAPAAADGGCCCGGKESSEATSTTATPAGSSDCCGGDAAGDGDASNHHRIGHIRLLRLR